MCKASIGDPDAPKGRPNDDVTFGTNGYRMGTVNRHSPTGGGKSGSGATAEMRDSCLVCVHTGAEFLVNEMPNDVRMTLDLEDEETLRLIFVETPGSEFEVIHDLVVIEGRADLGQIPLAAFKGCRATILTAPKRGEVTPQEAVGMAAMTVMVNDEDPFTMLSRIVAEAGEDDGNTGTPPAGTTPTRTETQTRVPA